MVHLGAYRNSDEDDHNIYFIYNIGKCIIFCSRSVVLVFKAKPVFARTKYTRLYRIMSLLSSTGFSIRFAEHPSHEDDG